MYTVSLLLLLLWLPLLLLLLLPMLRCFRYPCFFARSLPAFDSAFLSFLRFCLKQLSAQGPRRSLSRISCVAHNSIMQLCSHQQQHASCILLFARKWIEHEVSSRILESSLNQCYSTWRTHKVFPSVTVVQFMHLDCLWDPDSEDFFEDFLFFFFLAYVWR